VTVYSTLDLKKMKGSSLTLNSGQQMPLVGLGTWKVRYWYLVVIVITLFIILVIGNT